MELRMKSVTWFVTDRTDMDRCATRLALARALELRVYPGANWCRHVQARACLDPFALTGTAAGVDALTPVRRCLAHCGRYAPEQHSSVSAGRRRPDV